MAECDKSKDLELTERTLVFKLEKEVRAMFEWTGWEDGTDDEPRAALLRVRSTLQDIESLRKIMNALSADCRETEGHT